MLLTVAHIKSKIPWIRQQILHLILPQLNATCLLCYYLMTFFVKNTYISRVTIETLVCVAKPTIFITQSIASKNVCNVSMAVYRFVVIFISDYHIIEFTSSILSLNLHN